MNRRWLLPAAAVLVAVLIGSAAYSETKSADKTAARAKIDKLEGVFLTRLAKALGISEDKLRSAFKTAGGETIDDAVRQGLLSREQAAFLKGRLGSGELDFGFGWGHLKRGFGRGHGRLKEFGHGRFSALSALFMNEQARAAIGDAIAKKLGLTREGLAKALGEGKDLEDLAAAKRVTEEQIGAAVSVAAKPYLDRLVRAGTLERAEADMLLAHLARGGWLGKLARLSLIAKR